MNAEYQRSKPLPGYLTVYVSLSLMIILSLIFVLVFGARRNAARMEVEAAAQTAAESALAEYHRELLERYGLLFIDLSYGTGQPDRLNLAGHLSHWMSRNLDHESFLPGVSQTSIVSGEVSGMEVEGMRGLCDNEFEALRQQVMAYYCVLPGERGITELADVPALSDLLPEGAGTFAEDRQVNTQQLQGLTVAELDPVTGETMEEPVEDPGNAVNAFRSLPILSQVLDSGQSISDAAIDADILSHRGIQCYEGIEAESQHYYETADSVVLEHYFFQKCGNFLEPKPDSDLRYQLEYILWGKESDRENLEKTVRRILEIREVVNLGYLFTDPGKRAEAETAAASFCSLTMTPELTSLVAAAILFAWGYVETLSDLKTLLHGGRIPAVKTAATWHTDLWDILSPGTVGAYEGGSGLSYCDFLRMLMAAEGTGTKCLNFLDVCEHEIRQTEGNADFRIDGCVDTFRFRAAATVSTGYQADVEMTRGYN